MANIHDVAQEAQVSISTVSRVLQGATNVLPETKQRVENAIQRLNYHPNRLAQQFRVQQTKNILVIVPELNSFYSEILSGIESIAAKNHFNTLIAKSYNDESAEMKYYEMLPQKQVDGIITFSMSIPKDHLIRFSQQYPIVIGCRYFGDSTIPNITIDNIKAIKDITSYMLTLGHRQICFLAGPSSLLLYKDRAEGYLSALRERGLPAEKAMVVHCNPSIRGGYDAVNTLVSESQISFTAIVASGDTMAIGAILALNEHGLKVPDEIAVSGFDDIDFASLFTPSLTTVRQPKFQIGVRAAVKLIDLVSGKELAIGREVLDHELVIRKSSGSFVGQLQP